MSSVHWNLESSAMNVVTRRDDYRSAGPHLLQRPFNLPLRLFNLSIAPHHCKKHTHHEKFLEGILRAAPMALRAAADDEQQFTMRAVVDTHRRFMDLSVVYTNDPVWVEHSIHIMELLLAEEKYKVVGFELEYTTLMPGLVPRSPLPR